MALPLYFFDEAILFNSLSWLVVQILIYKSTYQVLCLGSIAFNFYVRLPQDFLFLLENCSLGLFHPWREVHFTKMDNPGNLGQGDIKTNYIDYMFRNQCHLWSGMWNPENERLKQEMNRPCCNLCNSTMLPFLFQWKQCLNQGHFSNHFQSSWNDHYNPRIQCKTATFFTLQLLFFSSPSTRVFGPVKLESLYEPK